MDMLEFVFGPPNALAPNRPFYVVSTDHVGPNEIGVAEPFMFRIQSRNATLPTPSGSVSDTDLAKLMTVLWDLGIRPNRVMQQCDKGELTALRDHITDLRKILWNRLSIEE